MKNFNKEKKCSHKIIREKITKKIKAYFYCYKCGKLIIVKDYNIYESLNNEKLEFNPIKMILQMIMKQKEEIAFINNKYKKLNLDFSFNNSNIYIKNRDIFVSYLRRLCYKMNYKENTFYHCLNLLDSYLIYIVKKEISKRTIFLIVLGFFLISSKFKEDDIFEPNINQFCKIDKEVIVSQNEILNMEIKCLQIINYNMINYSAYDWLKIFNRIGIIFNTNTNNVKLELIYEKQKYFLKRLINSDILYKYNSFHIALSIIHISMENIFINNIINKDLFDVFLSIFNYKFADYEQCYINIKSILFNFYKGNNNETNKIELNKNNLKTCSNKSMQNILKYPIQLSNINNKIIKSQSKKLILHLNDIIYKSKNKSEKIIKIFKNKTENRENDNKNESNKINENNNFILTKNKIFFKKDKTHLTIDCNNIEILKNNKKDESNYNYNNIINYLFSNTKKDNKNNNKINSILLWSCTSRNNINNYNNESKDIDYGINKSNKNLFKKSLTSFSISPKNKIKANYLKENKFSLLSNLNLNKNNKENRLNAENNIEEMNSIKTFYNKNPIKTFILNKDLFSSTSSVKEWKDKKNIFLRNNINNFINSKNNNKMNYESIHPYIKNGLMNLSDN